MKVLHLVAASQLTGAAEPVLDLVRSLSALGVHVDLRVDTKRSGNLREVLRGLDLPVFDDLVLSTKAGPVAWLKDLMRLKALVSGYDLVHVHLSHDHVLARMASVFSSKRPIIVRSIHAARVLNGAAGRRWVLRGARGVTVACHAHSERLVRDHGFRDEQVLHLPGSVDSERFHPDSVARARVRADLQLRETDFAIGCVARFQAGRRHEVLLDAVASAKKELPDLMLVLIGHGETEDALRARASEADLSGGVLFPGYRREDLNDYLAAMDAAAWLVPGNDATSRAVLQAMAAGLPVIGGRVDAIQEMIVPDETGVLADPDDVESVRDAISFLAKARDRAKELGAAGRRRALEQYSPRARAERALAFYRDLLAAAGRATEI